MNQNIVSEPVSFWRVNNDIFMTQLQGMSTFEGRPQG